MDHIKFAQDLGHLVARAKFASEYPELEEKHGFWKSLPEEDKDKLLKLGIEEINATLDKSE